MQIFAGMTETGGPVNFALAKRFLDSLIHCYSNRYSLSRRLVNGLHLGFPEQMLTHKKRNLEQYIQQVLQDQ